MSKSFAFICPTRTTHQMTNYSNYSKPSELKQNSPFYILGQTHLMIIKTTLNREQILELSWLQIIVSKTEYSWIFLQIIFNVFQIKSLNDSQVEICLAVQGVS